MASRSSATITTNPYENIRSAGEELTTLVSRSEQIETLLRMSEEQSGLAKDVADWLSQLTQYLVNLQAAVEMNALAQKRSSPRGK